MGRSSSFSFLRCLSLLVCIGAVVFSLGSFWGKNWPKVTLGLDLRGGAHLLFEVDQQDLMTQHYNELRFKVRKILRSGRYNHLTVHPWGITWTEVSPPKTLPVWSNLTGVPMDYTTKGTERTLAYAQTSQISLLDQAVRQSIETIRQRIDSLGTREPLIQSYGQGRFVVQIPGIYDSRRVKSLIGRTAQLNFQIITQETYGTKVPDWHHADRFHYVLPEVLMTGHALHHVTVGFDDYQQPNIAFRLTHEGAERFATVTRQYQGRQLAILLDGKVLSAPVIKDPITTGTGTITGRFTLEEASDLSILMGTGSLPASLHCLEEKMIGPELGETSIRYGLQAGILAFLGVLLCMMWFYGFFSLFAGVALISNMGLILTCLILIDATLTLHGITGMVLTIGMAVDANVLIYERIKEEYRRNKNVALALTKGYHQALSSIWDSNLTTLIGALFLYSFGRGPVKGFAVTLGLGIVTSLFTSLWIVKILMDFGVKKRWITSIPGVKV